MITEYPTMSWWRVTLLGMALVSGCTKPNPKSCRDGTCTDPALPFCDVDGALSGTPETCIAVSCTPGEFEACRGDLAITCNGTGTSYDLIQCERGCDEAVGCRACEANETVCANGAVQRCDTTGTVVNSEPCVLGCFENEPRCRVIEPSNGLAPLMDMASLAEDLTLENATLYVPSGYVITQAGAVRLQSEPISIPDSPVPVQAFPVKTLTVVGTLDIRVDYDSKTAPAVAFLSHGDVRIDGAVRLLPSPPNDDYITPPPGSVSTGPCVGAGGVVDIGQPSWISGAGGGGGATQGGSGGSTWRSAGGAGGSAFPNPDLQPLRGGCRGGGPLYEAVAHGGGAIQVTSATRITIGPNSTIDANGTAGTIGTRIPGEHPGAEILPRGGGAGGGILLEAPEVTLESGAMLLANGGGGASGDGNPASPPAGPLPSFGGECTLPASNCTGGGDGGSSQGPARTASSISTTNLDYVYTGGGGGAAGHIRINTKSGTFTRANDAVESPAASAGVITTR